MLTLLYVKSSFVCLSKQKINMSLGNSGKKNYFQNKRVFCYILKILDVLARKSLESNLRNENTMF